MTTPSDGTVTDLHLERQVVQGLLVDDMDGVWPAARALGNQRLIGLVATTAAALVFKMWPEDPSPAEFPVYAQRISAQASGEAAVAPALIEAVLRGALGEYQLIEDLPAEDLLPAYMLVIQTGVHAVLTDPGERERVLEDVLAALRSE